MNVCLSKKSLPGPVLFIPTLKAFHGRIITESLLCAPDDVVIILWAKLESGKRLCKRKILKVGIKCSHSKFLKMIIQTKFSNTIDTIDFDLGSFIVPSKLSTCN